MTSNPRQMVVHTLAGGRQGPISQVGFEVKIEGCVLSPLLYSLFTHGCVALHDANSIIKFADDATVVGLITDNDELGEEAEERTRPIHIHGTALERVSSFKFLGVHVTDDLTWIINTTTLVKRAQQHLCFLRLLKIFGIPPWVLSKYYPLHYPEPPHQLHHGLVQELLRPRPQGPPASSEDSPVHHWGRVPTHPGQILETVPEEVLQHHPSYELFTPLPSGRWYWSMRSDINRLRDNFYLQTITAEHLIKLD
ncbi:uncharacterized protein ACWYII_012624 [Salvelinus alpinus]